jgi:polysaccharide biosynthesis protein PslF
MVLLLGSYTPRECGIATFTADVKSAFDGAFTSRTDVIAIDEPGGETRTYPPEVVARLREEDRGSYQEIARFIDRHPADLVNVQHEYGLFGGERGEWLLDLFDATHKPIVLTLHTVLPEPDETMMRVTRELCARAARVVALSATGSDLLERVYGVEPERLRVVHHGVPDVPFVTTDAPKAAFGFRDRMVVSTFGLINRGKGLEYAIEAMRDVANAHPEVLYLILGQTHPVVRRKEGESYRESLQDLVRSHGLDYNVQLVDKYLDFDELVRYLQATDIYLTPYLNPTQIVSGTLAYAVGCGKAIVSTPYLYAQELLAYGRGFLCEFRDDRSIAARLKALLGDPALRHSTERRAYRFGRKMTWPHVAREYGRLFAELSGELPLVTSA